MWGIETLGPDELAIRLVVKTQAAEQFQTLRELRAGSKRPSRTSTSTPRTTKTPPPAAREGQPSGARLTVTEKVSPTSVTSSEITPAAFTS